MVMKRSRPKIMAARPMLIRSNARTSLKLDERISFKAFTCESLLVEEVAGTGEGGSVLRLLIGEGRALFDYVCILGACASACELSIGADIELCRVPVGSGSGFLKGSH